MNFDVTDVDVRNLRVGTGQGNTASSRGSRRKIRHSPPILRRHWRTLTKRRNLLRVASVTMPLLAFVYISITNDVLRTQRESGRRIATADAEVGLTPDWQISDSSVQAASAVDAPGAGRSDIDVELVPGSVDGGIESIDPIASEAEQMHGIASRSAGRVTVPVAEMRTYRIKEGGSLWGTGRRFLFDAVVLDRLVDNLAASGMNVRRVFPGAEFQVEKVDDEHLVVRIDQGPRSYISRIIDGRVSTSVRRSVTVAIASTFIDDALVVDLDDGVVAEILARDKDMSLGVDSASPGDRLRFELRETREFGSVTMMTDIVRIEKNGEILWRETANLDAWTAALGE